MSTGDADSAAAVTQTKEGEQKESKQEATNGDSTEMVPLEKKITSEMMKNPQVLAALQQQLGSIVGTPSGYVEALPPNVKRRINALKNLQVSCGRIETKFYEEVYNLEKKYSELYAPLFDKRCTIVNGRYEPRDSECEWESDSEDEEEEDKKEKTEENKPLIPPISDEEAAKIQGIPEFWLTIFKNTEMLQDMVQDHDEPALKHLQDIKVVFNQKDDQPMGSKAAGFETENYLSMGFALEFIFSPNEYFTNTVLTKQYKMKSDLDDKDPFSFDGPEIIACSGCEIKWKKGKNVTVKTIKKKQKHKGSGTVRTISKQVANDSFFNFFSPPEVPEDEDDLDTDTEALLGSDFELGHLIRERIVPRAVLYFTGEAQMDFDYDDDEEEEEGEGGFDADGNSEDDSDYDPEKDVKAQEKPQECKQQ